MSRNSFSTRRAVYIASSNSGPLWRAQDDEDTITRDPSLRKRKIGARCIATTSNDRFPIFRIINAIPPPPPSSPPSFAPSDDEVPKLRLMQPQPSRPIHFAHFAFRRKPVVTPRKKKRRLWVESDIADTMGADNLVMAAVDQRGYVYWIDFAANRYTLVTKTGVCASAVEVIAGEGHSEIVVGFSDMSLRSYSTETRQQRADIRLQSHIGPIHTFSSHPTLPLLLATSSTEATLWDTRDWSKLRVLSSPLFLPIYHALFTPTGEEIATSFGDASVVVWELDGLAQVWKVVGLEGAKEKEAKGPVLAINEDLMAIGWNGLVQIWRRKERRLARIIPLERITSSPISQLIFLPAQNDSKNLHTLIVRFTNGRAVFLEFEPYGSHPAIVHRLRGIDKVSELEVRGNLIAGIGEEGGTICVWELEELVGGARKEQREGIPAVSKDGETDSEASLLSDEPSIFQWHEGKEEKEIGGDGQRNKRTRESRPGNELNREALLKNLKKAGKYPTKYRSQIWKFLLGLRGEDSNVLCECAHQTILDRVICSFGKWLGRLEHTQQPNTSDPMFLEKWTSVVATRLFQVFSGPARVRSEEEKRREEPKVAILTIEALKCIYEKWQISNSNVEVVLDIVSQSNRWLVRHLKECEIDGSSWMADVWILPVGPSQREDDGWPILFDHLISHSRCFCEFMMAARLLHLQKQLIRTQEFEDLIANDIIPIEDLLDNTYYIVREIAKTADVEQKQVPRKRTASSSPDAQARAPPPFRIGVPRTTKMLEKDAGEERTCEKPVARMTSVDIWNQIYLEEVEIVRQKLFGKSEEHSDDIPM
ncbi:uncharacterized protein VTP21DRAFT_11642 [Calcarisporiella thermophila]|uniref:uncharacterized protein n=1 Tax=Calcarisporiella thermophila TaxID=911321 RepID=UPI0037425483